MHAKLNELEVRVIIKKSNCDKNHDNEFSDIIKSESTRVEGKRNDSDIHSDAILVGERRAARLQGTDALTDQAGYQARRTVPSTLHANDCPKCPFEYKFIDFKLVTQD